MMAPICVRPQTCAFGRFSIGRRRERSARLQLDRYLLKRDEDPCPGASLVADGVAHEAKRLDRARRVGWGANTASQTSSEIINPKVCSMLGSALGIRIPQMPVSALRIRIPRMPVSALTLLGWLNYFPKILLLPALQSIRIRIPRIPVSTIEI